MATALDPRFKRLKSLDKHDRRRAWLLVQQAVDDIQRKHDRAALHAQQQQAAGDLAEIGLANSSSNSSSSARRGNSDAGSVYNGASNGNSNSSSGHSYSNSAAPLPLGALPYPHQQGYTMQLNDISSNSSNGCSASHLTAAAATDLTAAAVAAVAAVKANSSSSSSSNGASSGGGSSYIAEDAPPPLAVPQLSGHISLGGREMSLMMLAPADPPDAFVLEYLISGEDSSSEDEQQQYDDDALYERGGDSPGVDPEDSKAGGERLRKRRRLSGGPASVIRAGTELARFKQQYTPLPNGCDPLQWWREHTVAFPVLSGLALELLSFRGN
jgi:hypothetical protein